MDQTTSRLKVNLPGMQQLTTRPGETPGGPVSPGLQAQLSPSSQLPRLADDQLKSLEENFQGNRNPSDLDIAIMAAEVGLPEDQVRVWFEHRLARWRQKQGLPANSRTINQ